MPSKNWSSVYHFRVQMFFIIFCCFLTICCHSYPEILIRAQCQVRCLEKFGALYTRTSRSGDVHKQHLCLDECKDCWSACEIQSPNVDMCFELCHRFKNQTTCRSGCDFHFSLKDKFSSLPSKDDSLGVFGVVNGVKLVCMNLQGNVESPSILASFFIELNETNSAIQPKVFVVYVRQKMKNIFHTNVTDWYPLGIRTEQTFSLHKLLPGYEYQLKARAVFANEVSAEAADSKWIRTLSGDARLEPPSVTTVVRQFVDNGKLLAELSWMPEPAYPSCFYHLIWRNDLTTESRTFPVEERHAYILDNLNYSMNYTVLLRSVSSLKIPRLESPTISTAFHSWSCLESNRFDFQICEPGPVLNLSSSASFNGTALVSWQKPQYVTVTNGITHYSIRWRSLPHLGRCFKHLEKKLFLLANETSMAFDNLGKNCFYLFEISAVSPGGTSVQKSIQFNYTVPEKADSESYLRVPFQPELFVLIPVTVGIIIFGVLLGLRFRPKKDLQQKMAPAVDRTWLRMILQRYGTNAWYEPNLDHTEVLSDLSPFISELENLGSGHFGSVWKAACTIPGLPTIVAVKKLKTNQLFDSKESEKHLQNELRVMKEKISTHPNIVQFFGVCLYPELKLVMEFCSEGSLKSYLVEIRDTLIAKPQASPGADSGYDKHYDLAHGEESSSTQINLALIDSTVLLSYGRQIAAGMQHLANCQLVHRDLAARNVLVTDKGRVAKVSDFGLCREGSVYHQTNNDAVPWRWLAPESLISKKFTSQSDVWSFGVLLWELATIGGEPYFGCNREQLIFMHSSGERLPKPDNCSQKLYNLMHACWSMDESMRPSFSNLLSFLDELLESNEQYISLDIDADSVYYHC